MSPVPNKIGPYRILKQIGSGGMGEVFLAYDERLQRRVAIKRVRPDRGSTPESRERFLREARVAAKLNHPALVQIYDVLTERLGNYIVMEYVEGANLRRLLAGGPLPAEEVVAIARDVAAGLAEAHRHGVVHRDLKSENVLITPEGHAKITDFGIAKWLLDSSEPPLTERGHVPGTYRVMSPEQARGEVVDHRSDLFSLGVLLYEALAGRSPFAAENELATLHRIIHDRQTPVRELNPVVSEELSGMVDHLLEKDPLLRPRSAREVARTLSGFSIAAAADPAAETVTESCPAIAGPPPAARPGGVPADPARSGSGTFASPSRIHSLTGIAFLLVLVVASISYLASRPPAEPVYVAVLQPATANPPGDDEGRLFVTEIRVSLLRGLLALKGISPKNFDEVDAVSGPPPAVARAVAADEIVSSHLACRGEVCQILIQRLNGADGTVLWAESFAVPTDNIHLATNAVTSQIRRAYEDHEPWEGEAAPEIDAATLERFLELRRRFDDRQDSGPIHAGLASIRKASPRFMDVYLLEAEVLRYQFHESRDPGDLQRAFAVIRAARDLAPENPQPLFVLFDVALTGRELARAQEALGALERLIPGDVRVTDRRARLLKAQGRSREAIALLRAAIARQPSWKRLSILARMESQNGEIDAARLHLRDLLSRAPGNIDGLSLLADIELTNGDPNRAAALYREILSRSDSSSKLTNLGLAYLLLKRYAEAAEACRLALEKEPGNPVFTLNLADAYLLAGRRADADDLYQRVVALIAADPASHGAQFLTIKAQALAHLGRGPEAVAAVQEALRISPGDAATAFEASVVHAVLGEEESAVLHAKRAVQLGYEKRWFTFPWFEPLRSRSEFTSLFPPEPRPD